MKTCSLVVRSWSETVVSNRDIIADIGEVGDACPPNSRRQVVALLLIFTNMEQNTEIELNGEEHTGESEEKKKKKRKLVPALFYK